MMVRPPCNSSASCGQLDRARCCWNAEMGRTELHGSAGSFPRHLESIANEVGRSLRRQAHASPTHEMTTMFYIDETETKTTTRMVRA
jgi:hypothetical protein